MPNALVTAFLFTLFFINAALAEGGVTLTHSQENVAIARQGEFIIASTYGEKGRARVDVDIVSEVAERSKQQALQNCALVHQTLCVIVSTTVNENRTALTTIAIAVSVAKPANL
jgi:hypothetical protein